MSKEQISRLYKKHNRSRSQGYVYGSKQRFQPMVDYLDSIVKPDHKILDLGCRDCALVEKYIHLIDKENFFGVDIDEIALEVARGNGFNVTHDEINAFLSNHTNKYNVVIISEVLEHLADPLHTIKLLSKVLTENGYVLITVPNAFRLKNRLKFIMGKAFEEDYTHLRWYNEEILNHYFESHQFKLIHFDYINSNYLYLNKKLFANNILAIYQS